MQLGSVAAMPEGRCCTARALKNRTVGAHWCTMHHMKTPLPKNPPALVQAYADTNGIPPGRLPPEQAAEKPETIRLTIPVNARVHEAFTRIAAASSLPVGRCMADWLLDTIDAAEFMAETLEGARAAPRMVAQRLHAYALGITDETGAVLERFRKRDAEAAMVDAAGRLARTASATRAAGNIPPVGNTGGKVTKPTRVPRGGKS